ncbi:zinc knuckle [Ostertagia ostertagi]
MAQCIERSRKVANAVRFAVRSSYDSRQDEVRDRSKTVSPSSATKTEKPGQLDGNREIKACSFCKKEGHYRRDCWKARGDRNTQSQKVQSVQSPPSTASLPNPNSVPKKQRKESSETFTTIVGIAIKSRRIQS